MKIFFVLLPMLMILLGFSEVAAQSTSVPNAAAPFSDIKIDQKLNNSLPLELQFRDDDGQEKKLGTFFGKKPVIIAPVYYNCPMLCTLILNGLTQSLNALSFQAGQEFDVLAISFDPRETTQLAQEKKKLYLEQYRHKNTAAGWHFLTGSEANIKVLMDALGFHYRFDPKTNQYLHASGIMVTTPEGRLARYFYGIEYSPRDLRLGLVEASNNKIGNPVDQIILLCYHYDPATGKYGPMVKNIIRLGGLLTVIILAFFLKRMLRPDQRQSATDGFNAQSPTS
jgi:protein SCO1